MNKPLPREDLEHVLEHTRELWESVRGRRMFVTGGTGFFGCWLLETFAFANERLDLGAGLVALTRNPDAFRAKVPHLGSHPAITLWMGDVRDFAFPPGDFSHVIHAATTSGAPVASIEMLDTITGGTRRALDFSVACGAKAFLLVSSGAVYGKQPPDLTHIPETYLGSPDPSDPNSTYAEGKRVAELLCAIYAKEHHIGTKIARCFAFVGPHLPLDAHFAIGNFIRDAAQGGPIRVSGDGTPFRSYLYAGDLAIWLWTLLFDGRPCHPVNLGSDEAISIADLALLVGGVFGAETVIAAAPVPGIVPARYVPDTRYAQHQLNLRAWTGLRDAVDKTGRWYFPHSVTRDEPPLGAAREHSGGNTQDHPLRSTAT